MNDAYEKYFGCFVIFAFVFWLTVACGIGYAAIHFIQKYW